jgi:hypothetical protein
LIVKTLGILLGVPTSDAVYAQVSFVTGGATSEFFVPITFIATQSGVDYYAATLQVDVYADPSSAITLVATLPGGGSSSKTILTVSGYLV